MDAFLNRGGGAVYIHYAVDGGMDAPGFAQRIGLHGRAENPDFVMDRWTLDSTRELIIPSEETSKRSAFTTKVTGSLQATLKKLPIWRLVLKTGSRNRFFGRSNRRQGRVVVSIPGHYAWTFDDPRFRILILRGIAWAAREPVDRFNDLVLPEQGFATRTAEQNL